jgi:hypothetical protein
MIKTKNIFTNKSSYIFILGALFVLLFLRQCNRIEKLKNEVTIAQDDANRSFNNYLASKDSVSILKNSNGDLLATIRSYEFDVSNLKGDQKAMIDKYTKVLNLNKDLNRVNTLLKADLELKDSLLAATTITQIDSTTSRIAYDRFDDFGGGNTRSLTGSSVVRFENGKFQVLGQSQFNIEQTLTLSAAVEEVDGSNRLKLSTSYPGLEISNIENINLINTKLNQRSKKKAGWSVGIGVGYGINLNNNQVISTGPSIGIGVYWSPKFLRF